VWGENWAFDEPAPDEMDAGLVVWKIHQRIDRSQLPNRRTVVEFEFSGPNAKRVWLVLEPSEVSVCVTPPRFESDLIVRTSVAYLLEVWFGRVDFDAAIRCGGVIVEGPSALVRQFPRWLLWSPMARFVRDRGGRGTPSIRRGVIRREYLTRQNDSGISLTDCCHFSGLRISSPYIYSG